MVGDVNSRNHQAYLLRFKANYIEKIRGYPHFSLWIPTALVRSLSRHRPGRKKKSTGRHGDSMTSDQLWRFRAFPNT